MNCKFSQTLLILTGIFLMLTACDNHQDEQQAEVIKEDGKIFIVDKTKKAWDITHAVHNYGFEAESFQYGLGPYAIQPILNPQMLSAGESGYPSSNETFLVIGTNLNGDTRAYPLSVLGRHEVTDEKFGNDYVAVAY